MSFQYHSHLNVLAIYLVCKFQMFHPALGHYPLLVVEHVELGRWNFGRL